MRGCVVGIVWGGDATWEPMPRATSHVFSSPLPRCMQLGNDVHAMFCPSCKPDDAQHVRIGRHGTLESISSLLQLVDRALQSSVTPVITMLEVRAGPSPRQEQSTEARLQLTRQHTRRGSPPRLSHAGRCARVRSWISPCSRRCAISGCVHHRMECLHRQPRRWIPCFQWGF